MSAFFDTVVFADSCAEHAFQERGADPVFTSLVETGSIEFSASPLTDTGCDVGLLLDDALAVAERCVASVPELAGGWESIGGAQTVFGEQDLDELAARAEALAHPGWSPDARVGLLSGLCAQMAIGRGQGDVSLSAVAPWTGANALLTETLARSSGTSLLRFAECPVVMLAPSSEHRDAAGYLRERELWGAGLRDLAFNLADSLWLSTIGCADETEIPAWAQSTARTIFAATSSRRLSVGLGVTVRRIALDRTALTSPAAGYDVVMRSMPGA